VNRLVVEGCAIATQDAAGTEFPRGHLVVEDGWITAVGPGPADTPGPRLDGGGCLLTPGLICCHHHLWQWATRGLAPEAGLFEWLQHLYPLWTRLDAELHFQACQAALAALALSGCTLVADHHYLFPAGSGDLLGAGAEAAAQVGLRLTLCRGSMDLGRSQGGLPPDEVVEATEAALAASEAAIDRYHDPSPESRLQVAVAPCSPFTVTPELMREAAGLARRRGVRLHTHLAETQDEERFCRERFGYGPAEYAEGLGWLGADVWLAHCVHIDQPGARRLAGTGTGVAHCPSSNGRLGAGLAPVAELLAAGVPVGLGVDGAASNECGQLLPELRQALLFARARGGPRALSPRQVLAMATIEGARCLGREAELGSLEPGKLADLALWRLDGLGHAGIPDPIVALVLGPPAPLELLLVGGRPVVEQGRLVTVDAARAARGAAVAQRRLLEGGR
jgi:cytosine/adenosine deaminase-related metal-dependent hydrolase